MDLDSKGRRTVQEWLTSYPYEDTYIGGALFLTPFDPALPATTPAGLGDSEIALNRLAEAVVLLAKARHCPRHTPRRSTTRPQDG